MLEAEPEYLLFAIIIICRWLSRASDFVPCVRDFININIATNHIININIITGNFIIAMIIIFTVTITITLQFD